MRYKHAPGSKQDQDDEDVREKEREGMDEAFPSVRDKVGDGIIGTIIDWLVHVLFS